MEKSASRRRIGSIVTLLLVLASSTFGHAPADAHLTNKLHNNWEGQPTWAQSGFGPPAAETTHHTETQAVFFANKWWLYHRIFRGTAPNGQEQFDIGYSTSAASDGNYYAPGTVVLRASSLGAYGIQPHWNLIAPKILVQPLAGTANGMMTMVFEVDKQLPKDVNGCSIGGAGRSVWAANSTNGTTWTDVRELFIALQPWEGNHGGCHKGNVGTPTITWRQGEGYYVTYHGFNGQVHALDRGYYFWPQSVGTSAKAITSGNFSRRSGVSPMTFTNEAGTQNAIRTTLPNDVGVGAADIMQPQGVDGQGDAYFYMVAERFRGGVECNAGTVTWLVLARATTPQGPWAIGDAVLLGEKVGCGRDLPSWQYQGGKYKIILSTYNPSPATWWDAKAWGLQRIYFT